MGGDPLRQRCYAPCKLAIKGIKVMKRLLQPVGLLLLEEVSKPLPQIVPVDLLDLGAVRSYHLNAGADGAALQVHQLFALLCVGWVIDGSCGIEDDSEVTDELGIECKVGVFQVDQNDPEPILASAFCRNNFPCTVSSAWVKSSTAWTKSPKFGTGTPPMAPPTFRCTISIHPAPSHYNIYYGSRIISGQAI
jgi:hypothetical protein